MMKENHEKESQTDSGDELQNSLRRISDTITEQKKGSSAFSVFLKKHSVLPKILSLLTAFFLWLYVFQAVDIEKTFNDIPIRMSGFDTGLDLDIASNYQSSVSVTVRGTNSAVKELTADDISASVDMSDINTVGHYSLPIHIDVPKNVTLSESSLQSMNIVVDKTVSRDIPVETELSYSIHDPYELGSLSLEPMSVIVRGPETDIVSIDRAVLAANLSDVRNDVTAQIPVTLYDVNGYEISSPYIVVSPSNISVKLPVNMRVKLPVDADVTYDKTRFEITCRPQHVYMFGPVIQVSEYASVGTGALDVSAVGTYQLPLDVADGVAVYRSNVFDDSNRISEVTVVVTEKPSVSDEPDMPANPDEVN